jgi:hypothetical protein
MQKIRVLIFCKRERAKTRKRNEWWWAIELLRGGWGL